MTSKPPRTIFCIGLGGVGVSAVAKLFRAAGARVSGSDPQQNPLIADLETLGVTYYADESPDHITSDLDLVVYTDDAGPDHPMRQRAAELGLPAENFSVTLNRLMVNYPVRIAIAGTNGKSTTTALTGLLLAGAGLDPTVVVGSRVTEFNGNVRKGNGTTFVVEADEYHDHFFNYQPTVAVLTNVEPDHLDYFGTIERMEDSFQQFLQRLPTNGIVVVNADDERALSLAQHSGQAVITFGLSGQADLQARDVVAGAGQQSWETFWRGQSLGRMTLPLPGQFNIMNALAAMAAALATDTPSQTFTTTLQSFHGIWRRFQVLNPGADVTVVSDYAHHPTAVAATITGAKAFYPGRRLVAVFQPHHRSRLTALFKDFAASCTAADEVYIVETYTVPGRDIPEAESKTSQELVQAIRAQGKKVNYLASPSELVTVLPPMIQPGDVVLVMGAGNIWRSAERLAQYYA